MSSFLRTSREAGDSEIKGIVMSRVIWRLVVAISYAMYATACAVLAVTEATNAVVAAALGAAAIAHVVFGLEALGRVLHPDGAQREKPDNGSPMERLKEASPKAKKPGWIH
jgi:hypothetical protein